VAKLAQAAKLGLGEERRDGASGLLQKF
jgi:hypothetical protein